VKPAGKPIVLKKTIVIKKLIRKTNSGCNFIGHKGTLFFDWQRVICDKKLLINLNQTKRITAFKIKHQE
jgi:hypothetical protein